MVYSSVCGQRVPEWPKHNKLVWVQGLFDSKLLGIEVREAY
jgi:hypothetical protein